MSSRALLAITGLCFGLAIGCSESASNNSAATRIDDVKQKLESPVPKQTEQKKGETAPQVGSGEQTWGHLKGRFTYGGEVPNAAKLAITKDQEVCGKHDLFDESVVVNSKNKGIQNVVVWLYQKRSDKKAAIHESYEKTASDKVHLDNSSCRFDGHVVGIRTSQTLLIRNLDPVGHNTKIDSISNSAINPILAANSELEHRFKKGERAPVPVSCSIHPWMNGYIVVQDHPYFAVTNGDGEFQIDNLPSGTWTFQTWHEATKYVTKVEVGGAKTTWKRGRFERQITSATSDLGDIVIAAEAFK